MWRIFISSTVSFASTILVVSPKHPLRRPDNALLLLPCSPRNRPEIWPIGFSDGGRVFYSFHEAKATEGIQKEEEEEAVLGHCTHFGVTAEGGDGPCRRFRTKFLLSCLAMPVKLHAIEGERGKKRKKMGKERKRKGYTCTRERREKAATVPKKYSA